MVGGLTGRMRVLTTWLLRSAIDASDIKYSQFTFFVRSCLKWKFCEAFGSALNPSQNLHVVLPEHMDPVLVDLCAA